MDLSLYSRVLWRWRLFVVPGLLLAIFAAVFSVARVGPHGVSYRQSEQYVSYSKIFVTQQGFPWGRLTPAANSTDPGRFASLATIYSSLADGDGVRQILQR